jgi:hypothetical protein
MEEFMSQFSLSNLFARAAGLLTLLMLTATLATAQVTTGSIQGVVTDPNGAVVAGATVKVTNTETGIAREATTNDEGFYRLTNLSPGRAYRVDVTASGFGSAAVENVALTIATENSVDIKLGLAQVGETVQVTSEAALLNPTQNQLVQNYSPQELTQLPYSGSIDNLALLTPGVVTPGDAAFSNGTGISANGNRGRSNNFQIDGQDNNDNSVAGPTLGFSNAEAIQEYQVITNNFSAEFGRNSGAQINVVTKGGTNEIHGTVFEYHNNSALDALTNTDKRDQAAANFLATNGFPQFAQVADRYPNPYLNNRLGGSIGGPLVKNKAFFFGTYQRDYRRGEVIVGNLGSGSFTLTPAAAAFAATRFPNAATAALTNTGRPGGPTTAGNGSGSFLIAPPTEDSNGDGVPDRFVFGPTGSIGSIDPSFVTPGFLAPLAVVSRSATDPTLVTLFGGELLRTRRSDNASDQFIGRTDYNITDRDQLIGRFIFDRNKFPLGAGGSSVAGSRQDYRDRTYNLGLTYTRTISPSTVNEARFNYQNLFVTFGDTSTQPGGALPFISFSGVGDLFGAGGTSFGSDNVFPQDRSVKVYQVQDTLSATRGTHALKIGADIRRQNLSTFFLPDFLGRYTFTGSFSSAATAGTNPAGTFFDVDNSSRAGLPSTAIENFLLGRPRTINFALGSPQIITHQNDLFLFVQDDWRIRSNLTLNLGLRYEVSSTPFNPLIEQLNTREANASTSIFPSTFPLDTRTFNKLPADKNNFGPRVGFAWSPDFNGWGDRFREGRTVVRGGFGIAYDPSFFNIVLNTVTASPFVGRGTFTQTPGAAGSVSFPFLPSTTAQLATTPGTNGGDPRLFSRTLVDPHFYSPYTMSFNFGVQQELWHNTVFEARYVGSRIVGQFQSVNSNPNIRLLNLAGQFVSGNPGQFTNGILPGSCSQATCITPTLANGFQNRTAAASAANGRLDPNFGIVQTRTNGASSTYNGLQTRFQTRLRNDFSALLTYSFSKTLDNTSEIFSTGGGGQFNALSQQPFEGNRSERGLSAFHQKHAMTAAFIYDLPFMRDQKGFVGKAVGGWQVNGILLFGSGRPYSPAEAFGRYDPNVSAFFRPFVGNPNAPQGTIAFGRFTLENIFGYSDAQSGTATASPFVIFDTRQPGQRGTPASNAQVLQNSQLVYNDFGILPTFFGNATAGTTNAVLSSLEAFQLFKTPYGDLGRNTFSGDPNYTVNLSLFKNFKFWEGKTLQVRAEAINFLNRRNFGVPDANAEDAFAGPDFRTSSFLNPGFNNGGSRSVRLGLRFEF